MSKPKLASESNEQTNAKLYQTIYSETFMYLVKTKQFKKLSDFVKNGPGKGPVNEFKIENPKIQQIHQYKLYLFGRDVLSIIISYEDQRWTINDMPITCFLECRQRTGILL